MQLLRQGGFIVLDNTLWYGNVIKQDDTSPETLAIRAVNKHVAADNRRVACSLAAPCSATARGELMGFALRVSPAARK